MQGNSRMFVDTEDSEYHNTHNSSNMYIPDSIPLLRKKDFKQIWRNHLLGIRMIQKKDLDSFISVHLFPAGNTYQLKVSEEYKKTLLRDYQTKFIPLTYEGFIEKGKIVFKGEIKFENWLEYLDERYIVH